jgi:CRISPR-associated endonuclease/helicase Cas3
MQFFTFNLPYTKKLDKFNDECCGIYLIDDYEDFIDENFKFNREKFMDNKNREFDFL